MQLVPGHHNSSLAYKLIRSRRGHGTGWAPDLQSDRGLGHQVSNERKENAIFGHHIGHQELPEGDHVHRLIGETRVHPCLGQPH